MKLTKNSLFAASSLAVGALFGASALVALADATWTAAPGTPPNNNVSAPVNVSATAQTKPGLLGLNTLMVNNLLIGTGTPTVGQVLSVKSVEHLNGVDYANVNWTAPATLAGGPAWTRVPLTTVADSSTSDTAPFAPGCLYTVVLYSISNEHNPNGLAVPAEIAPGYLVSSGGLYPSLHFTTSVSTGGSTTLAYNNKNAGNRTTTNDRYIAVVNGGFLGISSITNYGIYSLCFNSDTTFLSITGTK